MARRLLEAERRTPLAAGRSRNTVHSLSAAQVSRAQTAVDGSMSVRLSFCPCVCGHTENGAIIAVVIVIVVLVVVAVLVVAVVVVAVLLVVVVAVTVLVVAVAVLVVVAVVVAVLVVVVVAVLVVAIAVLVVAVAVVWCSGFDRFCLNTNS